jgi:hypothetical protein
MIRSITRQKSEEEIDRLLEGLDRVFIVGCGTCVTLTRPVTWSWLWRAII